jgi:hypothetical protein
MKDKGCLLWTNLIVIIVILIFILLVSFTASAQTSLSLLYTPQDRGIGLRADKQIEDYGLYSSVSYGNYIYPEAYVKDHFRLVVGATKQLKESYIGTGISINRYGDYHFEGKTVQRAIIPVSLEVCAGIRIERYIIGLAVDLLKYDIGINVGIVLNK